MVVNEIFTAGNRASCEHNQIREMNSRKQTHGTVPSSTHAGPGIPQLREARNVHDRDDSVELVFGNVCERLGKSPDAAQQEAGDIGREDTKLP